MSRPMVRMNVVSGSSLNCHRCFAFSLAVAIAATLGVSGSASAGVRAGDRAAEFVRVADNAGKRISIKAYKDRVVVLTFGASWCAPCRRELPAYEKLASRYVGKKVVFLAVNIDTDAGKGKKFMTQARLKLVRALFDPRGSTVESYDPPKMPSTFIISHGVVKHLHGGYSKGDENDIGRLVDKELAKL
jgi:thiol-disulfide isomerase/thioredoxin